MGHQQTLLVLLAVGQVGLALFVLLLLETFMGPMTLLA
jgi:hypothetical protein